MNRTRRIQNVLYYAAFSLFVFSTLLERSALIEITHTVSSFFSVIIALLFIGKIMLDKHTRRESIMILSSLLVVVCIRILGGPTFIVNTFLAFISIKGIDIRKIIKIDIVMKSFFLLTHATLFIIDYYMGIESALNFIHISSKGTAISLYFRNPNTTGLLGTWVALDMLYLKDAKRVRDFIAPVLVAALTFIVTTSRTPFYVFIFYLLLQFIRNNRALTVIQKMTYPALCVMTLAIVLFIAKGNPLYDSINSLTSGRIGYSVMAYDLVGLSILPSSANSVLLRPYIIDVFYIKCLVEYGIITLLLYYIPHFILPVRSDEKSKRISIISSLYLLFERAVANAGFAMPYLMIADAVINTDNTKNKNGA